VSGTVRGSRRLLQLPPPPRQPRRPDTLRTTTPEDHDPGVKRQRQLHTAPATNESPAQRPFPGDREGPLAFRRWLDVSTPRGGGGAPSLRRRTWPFSSDPLRHSGTDPLPEPGASDQVTLQPRVSQGTAPTRIVPPTESRRAAIRSKVSREEHRLVVTARAYILHPVTRRSGKASLSAVFADSPSNVTVSALAIREPRAHASARAPQGPPTVGLTTSGAFGGRGDARSGRLFMQLVSAGMVSDTHKVSARFRICDRLRSGKPTVSGLTPLGFVTKMQSTRRVSICERSPAYAGARRGPSE
jgi:hypothetical protein